MPNYCLGLTCEGAEDLTLVTFEGPQQGLVNIIGTLKNGGDNNGQRNGTTERKKTPYKEKTQAMKAPTGGGGARFGDKVHGISIGQVLQWEMYRCDRIIGHFTVQWLDIFCRGVQSSLLAFLVSS